MLYVDSDNSLVPAIGRFVGKPNLTINITDPNENTVASWLSNKLKPSQILPYLNALSTDNTTNIVTTYFGPRFVNLYDTAGFNTKYQSFTDPASTGTVDQLYQEIENALKNIESNINHFDTSLSTFKFDNIDGIKLTTIKGFITPGVTYYNEKRDLIRFTENLLKVASDCIVVDSKKYDNKLFNKAINLKGTGITDLTTSTRIYGSNNFISFISNLSGKNYPVYIGFLGQGFISDPYNDSLSNIPNLVSDLDVNIGSDTLAKYKDKITKLFTNMKLNKKYLLINKVLPDDNIKNSDLNQIEVDFAILKPIYDQVTIKGIKLSDHIQTIINYYSKLLEYSFTIMFIDLVKNNGTNTNFTNENALKSVDSYDFSKTRVLFDKVQIKPLFNSFVSTTITIKSYLDDKPKYLLPFSLFKPLYDDYSTKTDFTNLTSTKKVEDIYDEINNCLTHLNNHKARLNLTFTNEADVDLSNIKILVPANANNINVLNIAGNNKKLDSEINALNKYIDSVILLACKLFLSFNNPKPLDEDIYNSIETFDNLSQKVIGPNKILSIFDVYKKNVKFKSTVINTEKNGIEFFETLSPASRFQSVLLDKVNAKLDELFTTRSTPTGKTFGDLYAVLEQILQEIYQYYKILDKPNQGKIGTSLNSENDITFKEIKDIESYITSNKTYDSNINVYLSGSLSSPPIFTIDLHRAKTRVIEFVKKLLEGVYKMKMNDKAFGNLSGLSITNPVTSNDYSLDEWFDSLDTKSLLNELTLLKNNPTDIINIYGQIFNPAIVLLGGGGKSSDFYQKYMKYKIKYMKLKKVMGK
jgi:hypothetical protein